jgi:hypothetical protein
MENKNGAFSDYNHFEMNFRFFGRIFDFCQNRSSRFLLKQGLLPCELALPMTSPLSRSRMGERDTCGRSGQILTEFSFGTGLFPRHETFVE